MILVVGASGNLGSKIAQSLLAQNKAVRILLRPQSQALADPRAECILGDLKDRASLDQACQGVDTIITTANAGFRGGEDTPETVDLQGNRNLIDAAKAAGVKQFVFMSTIVADVNSPVPIAQAKAKTEEYLQASGIAYTIIAPNAFMEMSLVGFVGIPAMQGQTVTIVGEGSHRHSFISMHDVVAFTLAAVGNPTAINRKLFLGGPHALSFKDTVTIYERMLGRAITVHHAIPGEPVPGMPDIAVPILASFDMYESVMDTSDLAKTFNVQLTSFEEIARQSMVQVISA